ncbi:hypothetical protein Lal_00043207 [Lupinus albus]|nr:hypothetical protein Lal_00043207 [Lupinus albus]
MFGITSSSSRLLAYGIFISRIIDHIEIDTSDVEFQLTNTRDHLVGEHLIHKMGIYWITGQRMYQEAYRTTEDLDLSDEENPAAVPEQHLDATHDEASQAPPFGLAHLDAMEQRMNNKIDVGFQAINDIIDSGLMSLYDKVAADIQRETEHAKIEIDCITFIMQTMSSFSHPPPPTDKPSLDICLRLVLYRFRCYVLIVMSFDLFYFVVVVGGRSTDVLSRDLEAVVFEAILSILFDSRLSERFSPGRGRLTWESEILGYTGGFSPERKLSRLGEKWHFGAVETVRFSLERESIA